MPAPLSLTPQQCISLVVLNASCNQMAAGIAEAEAFNLPDIAVALKRSLKYLQEDRDRMVALWSRTIHVVPSLPANGVIQP